MSKEVVHLKHVLTRKLTFEASHQLDGLPLDQFGNEHQCSRMHGHSWGVEFQVSAHHLDAQGMVIDIDVFDELVKTFDHQTLNGRVKDDSGTAVNPTSENVARHFYARLTRLLLSMDLHAEVIVERVSVMETCGSRVDLIRQVVTI